VGDAVPVVEDPAPPVDAIATKKLTFCATQSRLLKKQRRKEVGRRLLLAKRNKAKQQEALDAITIPVVDKKSQTTSAAATNGRLQSKKQSKTQPSNNVPAAKSYKTAAKSYNTAAKSYNTAAKSHNTTAKNCTTTAKTHNTTAKTHNTTAKTHNTTAKTHNTTAKNCNSAVSASDQTLETQASAIYKHLQNLLTTLCNRQGYSVSECQNNSAVLSSLTSAIQQMSKHTPLVQATESSFHLGGERQGLTSSFLNQPASSGLTTAVQSSIAKHLMAQDDTVHRTSQIETVRANQISVEIDKLIAQSRELIKTSPDQYSTIVNDQIQDETAIQKACNILSHLLKTAITQLTKDQLSPTTTTQPSSVNQLTLQPSTSAQSQVPTPNNVHQTNDSKTQNYKPSSIPTLQTMKTSHTVDSLPSTLTHKHNQQQQSSKTPLRLVYVMCVAILECVNSCSAESAIFYTRLLYDRLLQQNITNTSAQFVPVNTNLYI